MKEAFPSPRRAAGRHRVLVATPPSIPTVDDEFKPSLQQVQGESKYRKCCILFLSLLLALAVQNSAFWTHTSELLFRASDDDAYDDDANATDDGGNYTIDDDGNYTGGNYTVDDDGNYTGYDDDSILNVTSVNATDDEDDNDSEEEEDGDDNDSAVVKMTTITTIQRKHDKSKRQEERKTTFNKAMIGQQLHPSKN